MTGSAPQAPRLQGGEFPDRNPVEYLWDEMREKYFSNLAFATIESLAVHLMHSLATLERDGERVRSITGWDWIIN